jgi:hypothetical protein
MFQKTRSLLNCTDIYDAVRVCRCAILDIISLASESRDFKKPLESRIFEFHLKLFKYGTLQAKQK